MTDIIVAALWNQIYIYSFFLSKKTMIKYATQCIRIEMTGIIFGHDLIEILIYTILNYNYDLHLLGSTYISIYAMYIVYQI